MNGIIMLTLVSSAISTQNTVVSDSVPSDSVPVSIELDDLVVTAKKDIIKSDGAKLTYSMQEDESSKGLSLLDALRKIPMVTVDGQDNIRINGQSNFKIYINGREDPMVEANYQRIFKSMPAESVVDVEVITEPGAQYDAEGTGGILNIITETKSKRQGYNGNIGMSYGVRQAAANANITARADKVYISANATYADSGPSYQTNDNRIVTVFKNNHEVDRQVSESHQKLKFNFVQAGLNMSWEPNNRNLFTWGGSYMSVRTKDFSGNNRNIIFDRSNSVAIDYASDVYAKMINQSVSANFSYRYSFNESGTHRLIAAYLFNFGNSLLDYNTETRNIANYPVTDPWQINHNNTFNREHTVQIDYSNPFGGEKHKLDIGFKGVFRHNLALSCGYTAATPTDMPAENSNNIKVNQDQNVYAGYANYTGMFNPVSVTAGVRYEHTMMGMTYLRGNHPDFTRHLDDVVPNAAISWIFAPAHTLRLSYQARISRPSINQLDPFKLVTPQSIQMGNPDLSSEYTNIVSLTYSNFGRILGGNIRLQYAQTDNAIVDYSYYEDLIHVSTCANFGITRRTSLTGFLNINISSSMTLSLNGEVNYTDMRSKRMGLHNSGWGGNYGANWSWTGPWDLKFNAYGGQALRSYNIQGYWGGYYYYGLGIGKDLLKDKSLHISLNANNFLNYSMYMRSYTNTADAMERGSYKSRNWNVGISINWTFGKMKESVRSTGLDIQNDDQSTVGNNKQGTGDLSR